ncbi:MAG: hypothetical protein ABSG65_06650 [Bryobacteraceae bacterium]|jgi:hypothetical protein
MPAPADANYFRKPIAPDRFLSPDYVLRDLMQREAMQPAIDNAQ